jgi:hypothetical protein
MPSTRVGVGIGSQCAAAMNARCTVHQATPCSTATPETASFDRAAQRSVDDLDADTTGPGLLLGLAPGRSGACLRTWLGEQATSSGRGSSWS